MNDRKIHRYIRSLSITFITYGLACERSFEKKEEEKNFGNSFFEDRLRKGGDYFYCKKGV